MIGSLSMLGLDQFHLKIYWPIPLHNEKNSVRCWSLVEMSAWLWLIRVSKPENSNKWVEHFSWNLFAFTPLIGNTRGVWTSSYSDTGLDEQPFWIDIRVWLSECCFWGEAFLITAQIRNWDPLCYKYFIRLLEETFLSGVNNFAGDEERSYSHYYFVPVMMCLLSEVCAY